MKSGEGSGLQVSMHQILKPQPPMIMRVPLGPEITETLLGGEAAVSQSGVSISSVRFVPAVAVAGVETVLVASTMQDVQRPSVCDSRLCMV